MEAPFMGCCNNIGHNDWMKDHPFAAALTYQPLYCALMHNAYTTLYEQQTTGESAKPNRIV